MNVFYLHASGALAAPDHCDKHVVKMIIEYAQLQSTTQWFAYAHELGLLPAWSGTISQLWLHIAELDFAKHDVSYDDVLVVYKLCRWLESLTKHGRKYPRRIKRIEVLREFLAAKEPDSLYARCYNPTHYNHPSAVWTRESTAHYRWLNDMSIELCAEYTRRYGRTHKTQAVLTWLGNNVPSLADSGFVEPPQCMPDQYKVPGDSVAAYRAYYIGDKRRIATWRYSTKPGWWPY